MVSLLHRAGSWPARHQARIVYGWDYRGI